MSRPIFTTHARTRMHERRIPESIAVRAITQPDQMNPGKESGTLESVLQWEGRHITAITRKNERGEPVLLSIWVDPPFPGTQDARKKKAYTAYRKAGFWGKLFISLRGIFGI